VYFLEQRRGTQRIREPPPPARRSLGGGGDNHPWRMGRTAAAAAAGAVGAVPPAGPSLNGWQSLGMNVSGGSEGLGESPNGGALHISLAGPPLPWEAPSALGKALPGVSDPSGLQRTRRAPEGEIGPKGDGPCPLLQRPGSRDGQDGGETPRLPFPQIQGKKEPPTTHVGGDWLSIRSAR